MRRTHQKRGVVVAAHEAVPEPFPQRLGEHALRGAVRIRRPKEELARAEFSRRHRLSGRHERSNALRQVQGSLSRGVMRARVDRPALSRPSDARADEATNRAVRSTETPRSWWPAVALAACTLAAFACRFYYAGAVIALLDVFPSPRTTCLGVQARAVSMCCALRTRAPL